MNQRNLNNPIGRFLTISDACRGIAAASVIVEEYDTSGIWHDIIPSCTLKTSVEHLRMEISVLKNPIIYTLTGKPLDSSIDFESKITISNGENVANCYLTRVERFRILRSMIKRQKELSRVKS